MPLNDAEFSEYESLSSLQSLSDAQMARLEALDGQSRAPVTPKESFISRLGRGAEEFMKPKEIPFVSESAQAWADLISKGAKAGEEKLGQLGAGTPFEALTTAGQGILTGIRGVANLGAMLAKPSIADAALAIGTGGGSLGLKFAKQGLLSQAELVNAAKMLRAAPAEIRAAETAKLVQQNGQKAVDEAMTLAEHESEQMIAAINKSKMAQQANKAPKPLPAAWQSTERIPIGIPPKQPKPFTLQAGLGADNQAALEAFRAKLPQGPGITVAPQPAPALPVQAPLPAPAAPAAVQAIQKPFPKAVAGAYTGKPNLSLIGNKTSQELAEGLTKQYGSVLEAGKGGVISDEKLTAIAQKLNLTPEEVAMFRANPESSAKVLAANAVKKDMLNQLKSEVVNVDINNPESMNAISRTITKTVNTMKGADALASEAGRSLRARQVPTTLLEKMENEKLDSIDAEALASSPEKLKEIVARLQSLKGMTQKELEDEVRKGLPFGRKLFEYVQANSLWSPITTFWNAIGGPVGLAAQFGVRSASSLAAIPERLAGAKGSQKLLEAPAMLAGHIDGMYDGLSKGLDILIKGTGGQMVSGERIAGAISGTKGEVIRFPFRLLQATDSIFETAAQRGEAWALAYRKASEKGGTLSEIISNAKNLLASDAEIASKAKLAGQEWTFKMPFGAEAKRLAAAGGIKNGVVPNMAYKAVEGMGEIGRDIAALRQKHPGTIGAFLLRFLNTPVNIFKLGSQLGPTAALSPRNLAALMASPELRADAIGRIAVGGTLSYALANGVMSGRITGPMPKDAASRRLWMEKGIRPYSLIVDGEYYPLDRVAILGSVVTTVADAVAAYQNKDEATASDMVEAAIFSAANNVTSQPFLQGMKDVINAVQFGNITKGAKKAVSGAAQSVIPAFSALGYIARSTDSTIRQPETIAEQTKASIPGLSKSVRPKLGAFGQEAQRNYKGGLILTSKAVNDPSIRLLETLDLPVPTYPERVKGVKLSKDQAFEIQKSAGPKIKAFLDSISDKGIRDISGARKFVKARIEAIIDSETNRVILGSRQ